MQTLYTNLTASLTELRDPMKVIEKANGKPVAILNRNNVVGYFVPFDTVDNLNPEPLGAGEIQGLYNKRKKTLQPVLDYLKDK